MIVIPLQPSTLVYCRQEQEKERELLEDRLTTIKNYDAEATQRMKDLRESQLLIEKKEVCWLCSVKPIRLDTSCFQDS